MIIINNSNIDYDNSEFRTSCVMHNYHASRNIYIFVDYFVKFGCKFIFCFFLLAVNIHLIYTSAIIK